MPVNGSTAGVEHDPKRSGGKAAVPSGPYAVIANDLRGAIRSGVLRTGHQLPTIKDLRTRYDVSSATAHRAVQLLKDEGLVSASRGRRAFVT
jgi:integrase